MSVDAGSVYSSVRIRLDSLDNDLKGVYARLNQLESNIKKTTEATKKTTSSFGDMFKAFVGANAVVGLAKKGFSLLTGAIKDSIRVSVESQEMISKYNVVFGGMGDASEQAAKRFADSFDLAGATAKEMLANTGNLLQGMGATKAESLALSEQVNTLASDLASFTNNQGGAKVASEALTKALLGEREQAKTLGIAILESDVQLRLAEKGQKNLTGTALKLAKAQATLELISEQAKNSIGDYARTADSAANSQKRAGEQTKELQIALGTFLTPAVTVLASAWGKVAGGIADVLKKHNELKDAQKAEKENNLTIEQRLVLLRKEQSEGEKLLKQYNVTRETAKQSNSEVVKNIATLLQGIDNEIAGMERFKKSYEAGQIAKAEADALAEEAARKREEQLKIEQEQITKRKEAEKEYQEALAFTNYQLENGMTTNAEANKANLSAAEKYIQALYDLGYAHESEIGTKGRAALDSLLALYPQLITLTTDYGEATVQTAEEAGVKTDLLLNNILAFPDALKKAEDAQLSWQEKSAQGAGLVSDGLSAVLNLVNAVNSSRLEGAQIALDKEYEAAKASGATEDELTALKERNEKKLAKMRYESAMDSWRLQLTLATAQAAQAVLNAYSSTLALGPAGLFTAPVAAGIAGAIGAVQVAAVAASKPIPSFQTGGIQEPRGSGTLVNVAENGYGEVMYNTGPSGQAHVDQMSAAIAANLAGRLVVEMNAREMGRMVDRQIGSNKR